MKAGYSSRLLPALLAAVLAVASPAQAFRMIQNTGTGRFSAGAPVPCDDPTGFAHWNVRLIDWLLNPGAQGAGMAGALAAAMASWTNIPNADHDLLVMGATTGGFATDGVNTLVWDTGNGCTGNCLALTGLVLNPGQVIVEADIVFNNDYTWRTDGGDIDTEAVAAHEVGHTLGIHHTEVTTGPTPTMNAIYFGVPGRSLEADDHRALQCSEGRFCTRLMLQGTGRTIFLRRQADITWNHLCFAVANVDVFRNGVKIITTANDGAHRDFPGFADGNYQVCLADTSTCSNVVSVSFPPPF